MVLGLGIWVFQGAVEMRPHKVGISKISEQLLQKALYDLDMDCTEELEPHIKKILEMVEWKKIIKHDSVICVKVNACHYDYFPGITNNLNVIYTIVSLLRDRAREVIVGESDLQRYDGMDALVGCGIKHVAEKAGAKVINFSKDILIDVDINGKILKKMKMPKTLVEADHFISVPLPKTHKLTTVSIGLKNQFGCIPRYDRLVYHKYLSDVLTDINDFLKPSIVITDGIIALEGDGPIAGIPKKLGILMASNNVLANDMVATEIMGFDWKEIDHVRTATERGIGPSCVDEIDVVGEDLDSVKTVFEPPASDFISNGERWLLKHQILSKIVYLSPLFTTMKKTAWTIRNISGYRGDYEKDERMREVWGDSYKKLLEG